MYICSSIILLVIFIVIFTLIIRNRRKLTAQQRAIVRYAYLLSFYRWWWWWCILINIRYSPFMKIFPIVIVTSTGHDYNPNSRHSVSQWIALDCSVLIWGVNPCRSCVMPHTHTHTRTQAETTLVHKKISTKLFLLREAKLYYLWDRPMKTDICKKKVQKEVLESLI